MAKIDLMKEAKELYTPSATSVSIVDVPSMSFLMIDGRGDPGSAPEYQAAVEALYAVAYAIKFKLKKSADGTDYAVMPLEGLWWTDDPSQFSLSNRDIWKWTLMIRQPDVVTADLFAEMVGEVEKKRKSNLPRLRLDPFSEGRSAQIMHIGPYGAAEEPTVAKLHRFIEEHGYQRRGKHHEIYLKDPRRSAPEKLQTIIRQPIA